MEEQLMTFNQTKRYLNVSRATLYRYAEQGKLPAYKMLDRWRFDKKHLQEWLDEQLNTNVKKSRKKRQK